MIWLGIAIYSVAIFALGWSYGKCAADDRARDMDDALQVTRVELMLAHMRTAQLQAFIASREPVAEAQARARYEARQRGGEA